MAAPPSSSFQQVSAPGAAAGSAAARRPGPAGEPKPPTSPAVRRREEVPKAGGRPSIPGERGPTRRPGSGVDCRAPKEQREIVVVLDKEREDLTVVHGRLSKRPVAERNAGRGPTSRPEGKRGTFLSRNGDELHRNNPFGSNRLGRSPSRLIALRGAEHRISPLRGSRPAALPAGPEDPENRSPDPSWTAPGKRLDVRPFLGPVQPANGAGHLVHWLSLVVRPTSR